MEKVTPGWVIDPNAYKAPLDLSQFWPVADWRCPVCSGPWLRNFVFAHKATCSVYRQESATQFADYSRLTSSNKRGFKRPTSISEWMLTQAFAPNWIGDSTETLASITEVRRTKDGRHRVAAGFDPNKIAELLAVKDENND